MKTQLSTRLLSAVNYILPVVMISGVVSSFAQSPNWLWAKSAGETNADVSNSISTDANGNVYIIGTFFSTTITFGNTTLTNTGAGDVFVVKYDPSGNVLWAKSAGGANDNDIGNGICVSANGDVYVTGSFYSSAIAFGSITLTNTANGFEDVFIAKYDPSGNVLWAKNAGGTDSDYGKSISMDANGNVYLTGAFYSNAITFGSTTLSNTTVSGTSMSDIFIVKYDGSGNVLWAKSAGGTSSEYGKSISADVYGNACITGYFNSTTITFGSTTLTKIGSSDFFLVKYDNSGNIIWAKNTGAPNAGSGAGSVFGLGISNDALGNIYVIGSFSGTAIIFGIDTLINTGIGYQDIFVVKYDPSGTVLWAKSAGNTKSDNGSSISTDAAGNSYITGLFAGTTITFGSTTLINTSTGSDIFVVKYDSSGNVSWAKSVGGTNWDEGSGISVDANNNVFVTGEFVSPTIAFGSYSLTNALSGTGDLFVAKLGAVSGIEDANNFIHAITIFPNPSNGIFAIKDEELQNKIYEVEIYNVMGEKVHDAPTLKGTNNSTLQVEGQTIDISSKPSGVYFVRLKTGKQIITEKIIKQ